MVIETYDPMSGTAIKRGPVVELDDIEQGRHARPTVFRCLKDSESIISSIHLSLTNGGNLGSSYAIFMNPSFIPNVSTGTNTFITLTSTPVPVPVNDSVSNYVWIDVLSPSGSTGPTKALFTLSFSYT